MPDNAIERQFDSPFLYRKNMLIILSKTRYNYHTREQYYHDISSKIIKSVKMSEGGALILFSSYEMLNFVYNLTSSELSHLNLLVQKKNTQSGHLIKSFKENENSVLFATQSLWEGVDIVGSNLRLLIITKLPYANVNDPLMNARSEYNNKNKIYIDNYSAEMLIKLKQGFGRLIRSEEDRGIVYLLDNRNTNFNYFFSPSNVPEIIFDDNLEESIESFLY